ncbi:MAG: exodeoxyribonuclease I, partial [Pseudomonadota bacterium]|nr:exodeoxyribonuclease I [Pseudomonadota bacterium]
MNTIVWYDYETFGANPAWDRPAQFAAIRTDEDLNEIEEPVEIFCRQSDDYLPHPEAVLITGITPQDCQRKGIPEREFIGQINDMFSQPGTCVVGYNSIRFDDEFTRYTLYRNFFDPYAREWQGGNSRWDLLDIVRCAYALRPDGIEWPKNDQGKTSFKLEHL